MGASEPCSQKCLPVYEVTESGIEEEKAKKLAAALKIPSENMLWRDGIATFIDPARYLRIPTVQVADDQVVAAKRRATTNHYPEIPIEVFAIDYAALERLQPLDPEEALNSTAAALDAAGLRPEHATPVVGHTLFKTVAAEGAARSTPSLTRKLDTHVSYRFTLDGYLLAGPGAQVQVSHDPDRNVTRLLHSTRTLQAGPSVPLIAADAVRGRFARFLRDDAEVTLRLVYWAPPLRPGINSPSRWNPAAIIPWYAVTIRRSVTNPRTRLAETHTSRVHLIPATDDPRFVPSVSIAASVPDDARVEARAFAAGGTPPYTYLWAGSNPDASSSTRDRASYVPLVRDYRRVLPAQSLQRTETVSITVVDANGIAARASQSVFVTARVAPNSHSSVTYGCESPNDPGPSPVDGSYAPERIAWQQAMGAAGQGGGSQRFCWLADDSWPGDFIEPSPAGSLPSSPWINGDADHSNWGINTANMVLYNGDGSPSGFSEMYPGATLADYNSGGGAALWAPGPGATVGIGGQNYDVKYAGAWGSPHPNDNLQWLAMYACQILEDDADAPSPWLRWGPAFNGLHTMLGFETTASDAGVGFMTDFPQNILGRNIFGIQFSAAQTIVQGWLNSAIANHMGTPAAMGPIETIKLDGFAFGISNAQDFYWGKGSVGPTIPQSNISGWWYVQGTDAIQEFP